MPYTIAPDVPRRLPWTSWISPGFEPSRGVPKSCLQQRCNELFSPDFLIHSALGLLDIQTSAYKPSLDAYARRAVL